jgi:hypothetical protein
MAFCAHASSTLLNARQHGSLKEALAMSIDVFYQPIDVQVVLEELFPWILGEGGGTKSLRRPIIITGGRPI